VRRILAAARTPVRDLIGNSLVLRSLKAGDFTDERFGLPTVTDILRELEKPGRDPRPGFTTAAFREGVETLADLAPGMVLEGVVTNVAAFGAFVDIGVHQDGLVHVSAMSRDFVSDPRQVAKPGDIVKVKVLSVDAGRKRISLTLRLDDEQRPASGSGRGPAKGADRAGPPDRQGTTGRASTPGSQPGGSRGAMAQALRRAGVIEPEKGAG
jgi:protein Tex